MSQSLPFDGNQLRGGREPGTTATPAQRRRLIHKRGHITQLKKSGRLRGFKARCLAKWEHAEHTDECWRWDHSGGTHRACNGHHW